MSSHDVERYELSAPPPYTFEVERRDFLKILGGGLVVVVSLPAIAQESGRGGQGRSEPADIAAWLHIDERGGIAAYTGKTEIGQNIRTSLAQAVADELRVPLERVTMVMADTDLVPYDAGTFGSQSTPRMGRTLSRAAAAAREMLIDRAADRWGVDRATLKADAGRVAAADGRSITYADLTKGQKLAGTVAAEENVTPPAQWTVRGTAPAKVNGRAIVTGAHAFAPDIVRPGMLFGRIVRPESIGATLVSLDDSRLRGIAGASIVRDGDFVGVVAPTERAVREAALAVRAAWKPLAGQPSSETIYEHLKRGGPSTGGGRNAAPPLGDVTRARAEAARTFDASYRIPYIAHVPLEPRAAVAEWGATEEHRNTQNGAGERLTVWAGTQRPFGVRSELASAFRIAEERVRVIVPDTGSAYGGKHTGEHAIEAARLARAAGRPVKLVWTRAEEFSWAYFRPAGVIDIKAAVDAQGRITAWEFDNWNSGAAAIRTPYDIPNQRIAFHQANSPLRQGSYRGLAATANHYAREMHMDAIARALGADPVEFRLRHLKDERIIAVLKAAAERAGWSNVPGSPKGLRYTPEPVPGSPKGLRYTPELVPGSPEGLRYARELVPGSPEGLRYARETDKGLRDTPERVAQGFSPAPGRALGIACGTEKGSVVATAAELSRTPDGFRVERLVVAFECGAIVNPDGLRNQVEGCVVQGLGGALFERVEFRNGTIVNGTMEQYRVPRFKDVPPIEIVLLDRKDLPPAGAGETPIVCVAPAIGAAARGFGGVAAELPVRLEV